jgi:glycolate oxidase iron-sulfur subunit
MGCTHCGLCLESCPTYTLWGSEPESPRGRIVLIEDAMAPGAGVTPAMAAHIDSCLGCMACMSVCPEEVPFGDLLASARTAIERQVHRPTPELVRRRAALTALPRAGRLARLSARSQIPHYTPARGTARGRVALLLGCTRASHAQLHKAALAVLSAEGYEVIAPRLPDCCGALELRAGAHRGGLQRAEATIKAVAGIGAVDHVVTSAGGCGVAMKDYGRLLGTPEARAFSALVLDVHELLTRAPLRSQIGQLAQRVAYHDACQLRHGQQIAQEPRELLTGIPGVALVELEIDAGACCGAPGIYRVTQPAAAAALGRRQAEAIIATGAAIVATADHACIGQLQRHLRELGAAVKVQHPIEVLAQAIEAGEAED